MSETLTNIVNRMRQTFAAIVTSSSQPSVVPVTGTIAALGTSYATLAPAGTALVDLELLGASFASAGLACMVDGTGTGVIHTKYYGISEETAQNGTGITLVPTHLATVDWTLGSSNALGYATGTPKMASAIDVDSTGAIEAECYGVGPKFWPSVDFGGTLIGPAGLVLPRVGRFNRILVAMWTDGTATGCYHKHQLSTVL